MINGYKIVKIKKHYYIINPMIKNDYERTVKNLWLCEKMSKKEASDRAKELAHARKAADIYNSNTRFAY